MVNFYGPRDSTGKKRLWKTLLEKMENSQVVYWFFIGDFNEVRSCSHRKTRNVYFFGSNSRRFEEFIMEASLLDVGLVGRKFTWSRLDGRCCSRIDRALVSNEWIAEWGSCKVRVLSKGSSNHCPIFLTTVVRVGDRSLFVLQCVVKES